MMASRGTLGTRCEAARRIAIGDSGLAGESLLPRLVDLARCSSKGEASRDPTADKETGDIDSILHEALRGTPINRCLLIVGDEVTGLLFLRGTRPVFAFYMGLLVVMMGYLFATGALEDIGTRALGLLGSATAEKAPEAGAAVPAK